MADRRYETLVLFHPEQGEPGAKDLATRIRSLIEDQGGTVSQVLEWGTRDLAYPIGKQKKGGFHIIYYTFESTKQAELERDFALQEGLILRQLTSKLDPKWKEEILKVAREDAGNGFALRGMMDEQAVQTDPAAIGGEPGIPGGDEGGPPPREGGGPPRRGRREMADKPD